MNSRILSVAFLFISLGFSKAQDVTKFFSTHNTVAFDDANLRFEQEGRVLVGDTLNIEQSINFGINTKIPTTDYSVAAGTIKSGGNWVNVNQGSVLGLNGVEGNYNMNSKGDKVSGQKAWDANLASYGFESMKQIKSEFEVLSDYLATLPTSGLFDDKDQNSYKITGNGKDVSVVNITSEQLAKAKGLELSVPGSGLLIVNVSGTNPMFDANFNGSSSKYASNILWNFSEAETVTANRRIEGSGLAPNATGKFNDGYEGSWMLNILAYMGGEGHFRPLLGLSIPKPIVKEPVEDTPVVIAPGNGGSNPVPSKVPEGGPGVLVLAILAGSLGMMRKRRA